MYTIRVIRHIILAVRFFIMVDNTSANGKGQIKERNATEFAASIEALTYQAPITRGR